MRPPEWGELEGRLRMGTRPDVFTASSCAGYDEPVRRFLCAAVADGTDLAPGAKLHMRGSIRLGRWLPFRAEQLLSPRLGTVWAARVGGVISGSDQYVSGRGGMDWRLFGRWRVMSAVGDDVSRSAAGRVAGESVWVPTAVAADPSALRAVSDNEVAVQLRLGGDAIEVTHRLAPDGRVLASSFLRWGDPDRTGVWGLHPFGLVVTGWRTFGAVTIPHEGRVGWYFGTTRWKDGEFFRFRIDRYELMGDVRRESGTSARAS